MRNYKFWVEASEEDEVLRCSDILYIYIYIYTFFFGGGNGY